MVGLHGHAGCTSGVGPFDRYGDYAAGKIRTFFPLLSTARRGQYRDLLPRLRCYCDRLEDYQPSEELAIGLIHTALSARNVLVDEGRVSGLLGWDFAMSGPFEEEFTSHYGCLHGLSDEDATLFYELLADRHVWPGLASAERAHHMQVYEAIFTFCQIHLWGKHEDEINRILQEQEAQLLSILEMEDC